VIAAVLLVLTLWLAISIFVAGLRWAIDGETQVDVGGPQARAVGEDFGPWGGTPS
jgi:hypothetical protein